VLILKGKVEGAYQTMLAVTNDNNFKGIEMEVIWKLYETCIIPIITYAAETWNTRVRDIKDLNRIQDKILKRILKTPITTPQETLYMETGFLNTQHLEYVKKMNLIRKMKDNNGTREKKILDSTAWGWKDGIEKILRKLGIEDGNINQEKGNKKELREIISEHQRQEIQQTGEKKSKVNFLMSNSRSETKERQQYLNKLSRDEASIIFKTRTRMIEVKCNYKTKYEKRGGLECRACGLARETQDHILNQCPVIHIEETNKVTRYDLFNEENMVAMSESAKKIKTILKILEDI